MNDEAGSGLGLPLQRAADGLQALAHAAQAVAFGSVGAAAVVGDLQRAQLVVALQPDAARCAWAWRTTLVTASRNASASTVSCAGLSGTVDARSPR